MVCLNQLTSCPQQKCCWYFLRITFSKSPRYRFASFTKDFPRGGSGLIRSIASSFFSPDASSLTSVSVFPESCFCASPFVVSDNTRVTSVGNASGGSSRDISSAAAAAASAVFRKAFSASYSASFGSGVNFTGGEVNPTYGAGVTHRSVSAYSKRQSASATWSFPHVRIIVETRRKPARASSGVAGETPSAKGFCENPGMSTTDNPNVSTPSRSAFSRAKTFRASDPFAPSALEPDPLPFIASTARRKIPFEPSQRWSTISESFNGRRNGARHCPG